MINQPPSDSGKNSSAKTFDVISTPASQIFSAQHERALETLTDKLEKIVRSSVRK